MTKSLFHSFLLLTVFAFTACGGGGQESADQQAEDTTMDTQEMADDVRTIDIIGVDAMKYVVEEDAEGIVTGDMVGDNMILEAIEAAPGEELRVVLTTVSQLPETAMAHNFILTEQGTDAEAFANASVTARDNDYIAPDYEDQVIIATEMLGAGESDTITFNAPEEPGEYVFFCSFPGHYAAGMWGVLRVSES